MKIKRILLGLGGTSYTPVAIRHAVDLARMHGAELAGVTVVDESRLSSTGAVPLGGAHLARALAEKRLSATRQQVEQAIGNLQKSCASADVVCKVHREKGEPFALMTDLARYHDLMIFGLRSLFDGGLGMDAEDTLTRLVRMGVRPILAVPPEYRPIHRVLLAYSGSPESAKAIKRFVQSWLWPDMLLRIVTCGPTQQGAEALAGQMAGYCRAHGLDPDVEVRQSPPKQHLMGAAERFDADLIVMGNGARSLWLDRILGGTTLHMIQNTDRALYLTQ